MPRRIEIEITSLQGDVATWRAAGAKLPKGTLSAGLVPGGPVVGTTYRADVEQFMEGLEVIAVLPAKSASPEDPRNERLAIIPRASDGPDVVVTYAPKGRGRRDRDDRDGREGRRGGRDDRREGRRSRPTTGERPSAGAEGETSKGPRGPRPARSDARPDARGRTPRPAGPPTSTVHRNAFLATLSPEQLPVAEQLLRGGMPAVRAAVEEQNRNATVQGRPTIDPVTIERIAEDLLGKTNLAAWKDRAAGAVAAGRELRLRELRAVVTAAKTVSLDDDARTQLKELQGALTTRIEALRTQWTERLEKAVSEGRVVDALQLVASPPDFSTRVSAEMATRVVALVSESLTADQDPATWREIVSLAADTSVRRNIKPAGIPGDEESRELAVKNAGAIPELAKLLGIKVPPPPPPMRSPRRTPTRRSS